MPSPPQAPPLGQGSLQSSAPPQPSPMRPQYTGPFMGAHDGMGVQLTGAQTLSMPRPPQVPPLGQAPQSMLPPHPSPTTPQRRPPLASQLIGAQLLRMQTLPLHVSPVSHDPQASARPHPSPMVSQ